MHVKQGVFIYVTMLSLYAVCSMLYAGLLLILVSKMKDVLTS